MRGGGGRNSQRVAFNEKSVSLAIRDPFLLKTKVGSDLPGSSVEDRLGSRLVLLPT